MSRFYWLMMTRIVVIYNMKINKQKKLKTSQYIKPVVQRKKIDIKVWAVGC